jgi:molybdate transport system substrate-binding protein
VHLIAALLTIAAASDLQAVLPALAARFERESGHTVRLTFGSSGNFYSQIQNGAPFDVFLSADIDYPRRLEAAGLAVRGSLVEYATGSLVVWVRNESRLDLARVLIALSSDDVRRIAIANPEHAPYGRAAVAALQNAKLYDRLRSKLVLGENVSQAAQFVQSGNADAGIIPLALARSPALGSIGRFATLSDSLYPPIEQGAVILGASRAKDAARAFLDFLNRPDIVRALRDAGFGAPIAHPSR